MTLNQGLLMLPQTLSPPSVLWSMPPAQSCTVTLPGPSLEVWAWAQTAECPCTLAFPWWLSSRGSWRHEEVLCLHDRGLSSTRVSLPWPAAP